MLAQTISVKAVGAPAYIRELIEKDKRIEELEREVHELKIVLDEFDSIIHDLRIRNEELQEIGSSAVNIVKAVDEASKKFITIYDGGKNKAALEVSRENEQLASVLLDIIEVYIEESVKF